MTRKLQQWCKDVKERDGYQCLNCGSRPKIKKMLEAHHIKPIKDFPELKYDIDNGITLCYHCHRKKFHGYLARKTKDVTGLINTRWRNVSII